MIGANSCTHISGTESPTRTKVTRAPFERDYNFGALSDHIVCKKDLAEKERLMRTGKMVIVSQETLIGTITGIPGLTEDAVTTLAATKGYNGIKRTGIR